MAEAILSGISGSSSGSSNSYERIAQKTYDASDEETYINIFSKVSGELATYLATYYDIYLTIDQLRMYSFSTSGDLGTFLHYIQGSSVRNEQIDHKIFSTSQNDYIDVTNYLPFKRLSLFLIHNIIFEVLEYNVYFSDITVTFYGRR